LGCRLNQGESEAIADEFRAQGFSVEPSWSAKSAAGLVIVNTCTVTSKADQKARGLLRRVMRENPGALVVATGCYASLDPEDLEALDDPGDGGLRRLFVPRMGKEGSGAGKAPLLELPALMREGAANGRGLREALESWASSRDGRAEGAPGDAFAFAPAESSPRARGFLKIQDGCDKACSYCRVREARGPSASVAPEEAVARLRSLEASGCAEAMISGVNVALYEHSGVGLARLIELLLEGTEKIAIRLSSLDPTIVDERLARAVEGPRARPYFHLSVQSGSDEVLRRMRRAYRARDVERAAGILRAVKGDPFLACDVIAGFPGEGDADFARTLELCARARFAWIHAFPYSPRQGTPAFSFPGAVRESLARERVDALLGMATAARRDYARAWLGREVAAVVEGGKASAGKKPALSENYLRLEVDCKGLKPKGGDPVRCVLADIRDGKAFDAGAELIT